MRLNVPRVEAVILGLYHAAEYRATWANALHPTDADAPLAQTQEWSRAACALRDEGGDAMIGVLERWARPRRSGLAPVWSEVPGYFRDPVDRMDDPTHEASGWYIGSGAVARARCWWRRDSASPPVEAARVLELGCASGGNLIPMADAFPGATFVGVDLSTRQIEDGRAQVARLGLTNVELRHASILDVDDSFGAFDYVLCHGVFSWVPTAVQDRILAIGAQNLAPAGVAYVSYNTYPGWYMRGMIHDMMRFHATKFAAPAERTRQALIDFLADSARPDTGLFPALLKSEFEAVRHQADHYLHHEHLEDVNDPLCFHEFVTRAGAHGLRYLGEARVGTMLSGAFGPDVEKALKLLATDQVQTEPYLDVLRNRMFRETLLVHGRNTPSWQIRPERVARLHVASGAVPAEGGAADVTYRSPSGVTVSTARPLLKGAMQVLAGAWPATVPFTDLLAQSRALCGSTETAEADARVVRWVGGPLPEFGPDRVPRRPGHRTPVPSEKPVETGPARVRAEMNRPIPTRRHDLGSPMRKIILYHQLAFIN